MTHGGTAQTAILAEGNHYRQVRVASAAWWGQWRDPIAGVLLSIGLCWPFVFSSILPSLRWWMFLPLAVVGGLLRQGTAQRPWKALAPLWALGAVVLVFAAAGFAVGPLTSYGEDKLLRLLTFALLGILAGVRQAPLTEGLARGFRWGLATTFAACLFVAVSNQALFLKAEELGVDELREVFSTTGFPLALALAAAWAIPRHTRLGPLLIGAGVLLLGAVLEVLVRGRFHAMTLCALAGLLVLGPPWRGYFWRLQAAAIFAIVAVAVYVNVLPLFGSSFTYLTWLSPESVGGRASLFSEAWQGFMAQPLGQGIGSFARIEPGFTYPHNVILEAAYELGALGLGVMVWMYAVVAHRAWQLWRSPPHRIFGAVLALVFLHMLKAGDLSTLAFQWVALYLLLVGTPLDERWALQKGDA